MDDPVLLTGAGGRVGQAILSRLADEYDWRLLDREPIPEDRRHGVPESASIVADVTDEHAVADAVAGCGAVIHLAGDPRPDASTSESSATNACS